MNTFRIDITRAEYQLFKRALDLSNSVGDCILTLRKDQVIFEDYEGVIGTIGRLLEVPTQVDPQLSIWLSLKKKINEGVDRATPR